MRHLGRATASVMLAAAVTVTGIGAAQAGTEHRVKTAPSPSVGTPIEGGGSWIVNKPSGYYLGRAVKGSTFDNEANSGNNWHYGRAGGPNMCGWVMPGSLGATTGRPSDSCSAATEERIKHRLNFGRDFNAKAHKAETGSSVPANGCTMYYNYFRGTDFASGGGHWANRAGSTGASVLYRFTTRDGKAAVVRDPTLGWGFVDASCVGRPERVHNDND